MKKAQRLFPQHQPERYTIELTPDLKTFTFSGKESIQLTLTKASKSMILHAVEIKVSKVSVTDSKKNSQTGKITYSKKDETVTFTFPKLISAGKITLDLEFTGILNDKMRGFYRSTYKLDGKDKFIATTQFEATDARKAFPCIDEPIAKAIFDVSLRIPKGMT